MTRPTLAAIARAHGAEILDELSPLQRRVLERIATCKTEAQGLHRRTCREGCGYEGLAYNSCRDRHCTGCLGCQAAQWTAAREAELLDVGYFHVVFTLPHELTGLARQNPAEMHALLFRAAAKTLQKVARIQRLLGAELGFLVVLHTWGRDLRYHPHVHCVVPGGGLTPDEDAPEGARWVPCRKPKFLLPVRLLASIYRAKFLEGLRELVQGGGLEFHGRLRHLEHPSSFENFLRALPKKWVVYAKPPFGGPEQVLRYLARYTHRVAISDRRIVSCQDGEVTFRFKDYRDGEKTKLRSLPATGFLKLFLDHVLPKGFVRIRYYGFLANRHRKEKVALCRRLLRGPTRTQFHTELALELDGESSGSHSPKCPSCGGLLKFTFGARPPPWSIRPFQPPATGPPPRRP